MSVAAQARRPRRVASVAIAAVDTAALVAVNGTVDEVFGGFGDLQGMRTVVIDVSAVTFMTSFGVGRWVKAMAAMPSSVSDLYLVGCPPIVVDQLNMILKFGGSSQIISLLAPYTCSQCRAESNEIIDVINEWRGVPPNKLCKKCNGKLVLDAIPDIYFSCMKDHAAKGIQPAAAQLLAADRSKLRWQEVKPAPRPVIALAPAAAAAPPTTPAPSSKGIYVVLGAIVMAIAGGAYLLAGRGL